MFTSHMLSRAMVHDSTAYASAMRLTNAQAAMIETLVLQIDKAEAAPQQIRQITIQMQESQAHWAEIIAGNGTLRALVAADERQAAGRFAGLSDAAHAVAHGIDGEAVWLRRQCHSLDYTTVCAQGLAIYPGGV